MKNIIYKLISPSKKSYIGLTNNFNKRMCDYKKSKNVCVIHTTIRKYGFKNFKKEVLQEVKNPKLLPELKKFYIKKYNTYNNEYNFTLGGEGIIRFKHSKETKRKIPNSRKGKLHINAILEGYIKLSETRKGKKFKQTKNIHEN